REAFTTLDAGFGAQRAEVQAVMAQTRSEVETALAATTTAVADALDEVSTDVLRRIRRLQLNQLLNLDLCEDFSCPFQRNSRPRSMRSRRASTPWHPVPRPRTS